MYQCWKQFLQFLYIFSGLFYESSKERHFKNISFFFYNILNVFTVTFDKCNISILNKKDKELKKKKKEILT